MYIFICQYLYWGGHLNKLFWPPRDGVAILDDGEHVVPAGSVVHVAPGTLREAFATQADTAVLVVGAARDQKFEISEWEIRQLKASGLG